jgi:ABC-type transport system involved in multi-copper enzyme maturation permease subunit
MNGILTITRLTIRESARRKIAQTAVILGVLLLVLFNIGFRTIFNQITTQDARAISIQFSNVFVLSGLYAINFLIIVLSTLISADSLAGEINSGSIQSLITKPLRRIEIFLGKWLGFAALLAIYLTLMGGGVILSAYLQVGYRLPNVAAGLGLMYVESLLVMSLTLACSASFSTLASGGAVFGLYGIAFIGSWVEQIGAVMKNESAVQIGILSSLLMPSEALWRRAAHEMSSPIMQMMGGYSPFSAASVPSTAMIVYAVLYLLAVAALGIRIFMRRDL